jgi:hypothetical protein
MCIVVRHSVVHHSLAGLKGGNVVGLLMGSGMGSKTPAARCSRELWPLGAHWEAEGGRVVEGQRQGTGWRGKYADGAWEDSLVHVAQVATHSVGVCCRTLVVLTWASTSHAGVLLSMPPPWVKQ